jgi:chromate reductase, NAD(P)H dehydrogenase (quinone)
MRRPKILVFAGSIRTGSFNGRLAALAAKELALLAADVTRISLADYPLPLYDGDAEAAGGAPENAKRLKRQFAAHHGIFIASPEYNASITPLLKNTLDWVSRVREAGEQPRAAFRDRVFALGAASNGTYGGYRSLIALRHVLELGCGALVLPDQVAIRNAASAFDEAENLRDAGDGDRLRSMLARLVDVAHQYAVP